MVKFQSVEFRNYDKSEITPEPLLKTYTIQFYLTRVWFNTISMLSREKTLVDVINALEMFYKAQAVEKVSQNLLMITSN